MLLCIYVFFTYIQYSIHCVYIYQNHKSQQEESHSILNQSIVKSTHSITINREIDTFSINQS